METIPNITIPVPALIFIFAVIVVFIGMTIKMLVDAKKSKHWPFKE